MTLDFRMDITSLRQVFELARHEDLGEHGDLTTQLLPETVRKTSGRWTLAARMPGRFCGAAILPIMLEALAPEIQIGWETPQPDGMPVAAGQIIARLSGPVDQMLAAERTLLNLLQHLAGIATMTSRFVAAVAGTSARIHDTRKTTPGLRQLEKYAVLCGGGHNHRAGLHDAVLIKDNHLAGTETNRLAHTVHEMLCRMDSLATQPSFVEVECDNVGQMSELLKVVGIDVILLDNFTFEDLSAAVELRDRAGLRGKVELEASGGVTLETVQSIAQTGVERIAVGAITHSAPILDLGLDAVS